MRVCAGAFFFALVAVTAARAEPAGFPAGAGAARAVPLSSLAMAADDAAPFMRAFQRSCVAVMDEAQAVSSAQPIPSNLQETCRQGLSLGELDSAAAKAFVEEYFEAWEVPGPGLLTGYYEPDFPGSLQKTAEFSVPLLSRPEDLLMMRAGDKLPGIPDGILGARRLPSGTFEPFQDRAAIEDGALGQTAKPIVFLRDIVDAFIVHVQGSAMIRLPDGSRIRVAFAGRNGRPYTSVARAIVQRMKIPPDQVDADKLTAWMRANPVEARTLLRTNKSYVFFRIAEELTGDDGPIGAAGVSLTAGRSIAVDRAVWPYGLPVWIEADVPLPKGGTEAIRRLVVAQDTGSAITGPARADLFVGSGTEAGERAGLMRHPLRFVVLWPKGAPVASTPLRR